MTDLYLYPFLIFIVYYQYLKRKTDTPNQSFSKSLFNWLRDLYLFIQPLNDYCNLKNLVPLVNPKLYDNFLWNIDKKIFMGISPTLFLSKHANLFWDKIFDATYSYVFPGLLIFGIFVYLSMGRTELRKFLFCYGLTYYLGLLGYYLLPSLGPLFTKYELLYKNRHFEFVQTIYRLLVYDRLHLLKDPLNYIPHFATGIAAFPSLHVAHYFIFVLYSRKFKNLKWLFGIILLIFILAYIATIYVGMHYFIDGIGGILLTLFSYYFAEKMVKKI